MDVVPIVVFTGIGYAALLLLPFVRDYYRARKLRRTLSSAARERGWRQRELKRGLQVEGPDFWIVASDDEAVVQVGIRNRLPETFVYESGVLELLAANTVLEPDLRASRTGKWLQFEARVDPAEDNAIGLAESLAARLRGLDDGHLDPARAVQHLAFTVRNPLVYGKAIDYLRNERLVDASIHALLERGLNHPNCVWQFEAARRDPSRAGFETLLQLVGRHYSERQKREALAALLSHPHLEHLDDEGRERLADILARHVNQSSGLLLAQLLRELPNRFGRVPPLRDLDLRLRAVDPIGRKAVLGCLERHFEPPRVEPMLTSTVENDRDTSVVAYAVDALGRIGSVRALRWLEQRREIDTTLDVQALTRAINQLRNRHANVLEGAGGLVLADDAQGGLSAPERDAGGLYAVEETAKHTKVEPA